MRKLCDVLYCRAEDFEVKEGVRRIVVKSSKLKKVNEALSGKYSGNSINSLEICTSRVYLISGVYVESFVSGNEGDDYILIVSELEEKVKKLSGKLGLGF